MSGALASGAHGGSQRPRRSLAQRARFSTSRRRIGTHPGKPSHANPAHPAMGADIVIGHRPNDYHPDHRYTGILMQDSAYMVGVPYFCPDVPALAKNPLFLYSTTTFSGRIRFARISSWRSTASSTEDRRHDPWSRSSSRRSPEQAESGLGGSGPTGEETRTGPRVLPPTGLPQSPTSIATS